MSKRAKIIHTIIGPLLYVLAVFILPNFITKESSEALGLLAWMVYWWVTQPVHMTVTAFLPMVMNAVFQYADQGTVVAQYFCESILLIFGTFLLTIPWEKTGFDRRVALKILSVVGPSMKSQLLVWALAPMLFSTVLPNLAVVALFCPIAIAMLNAAGYDDMSKCKQATPILLAIGWGACISGVGTPIGGAMNVTGITLLQDYLGHEIMYLDYVIRMLPYLIICCGVAILVHIGINRNLPSIEGTKEYFKDEYAKLGKISRDEIISGGLFGLGLIGCFARPLYADILPSLAPAYVLVALGMLTFFITCEDGEPMQTWAVAQNKTMWGMMLLFGGGLGLGTIISASGTSQVIADIAMSMNLTDPLLIMIFFAIIGIFLSEVTSSTVSAAITVPILIAVCDGLGLNIVPFWCALVMAYNGQFMLPISVLAVPISYGADANVMLKEGFLIMVLKFIIAVGVGYIAMLIWPAFSVI